MSIVYVNCEVFPGLFETEYYVLVNHSAAYHVHRNDVHVTGSAAPSVDKPVAGTVRAYLVETRDDRTLVQLPGEAAVGGLRTWVENEALVKHAY